MNIPDRLLSYIFFFFLILIACDFYTCHCCSKFKISNFKSNLISHSVWRLFTPWQTHTQLFLDTLLYCFIKLPPNIKRWLRNSPCLKVKSARPQFIIELSSVSGINKSNHLSIESAKNRLVQPSFSLSLWFYWFKKSEPLFKISSFSLLNKYF